MTTEEAVERVKATVASKRQSLDFAAPEVEDMHWADLEARLVVIVREVGK